MPISDLSGIDVLEDTNVRDNTIFNYTLLQNVSVINGHVLTPTSTAIDGANWYVYYSFQGITSNNNQNGWAPGNGVGNMYSSANDYWSSLGLIQDDIIPWGWYGAWNNNPTEIIQDVGNGHKWRNGARSILNTSTGTATNPGVYSNAGGINSSTSGTNSGTTGPDNNAEGSTLNFGSSNYFNATRGPFSLPYFGGYDPSAGNVAPDNIPQTSDTNDGYLYSEKTDSSNKTRFQVVRSPEYRFQQVNSVKYIGFAYHAFGADPDQNAGVNDYSIRTMANNLRYSYGGLTPETKEFVIGCYCSTHPNAHDENTNPDGIITDPAADHKAIFLGGPTIDELEDFAQTPDVTDGEQTDFRMVYLRIPPGEALGLTNDAKSLYFYFAFGPSGTGYRGDVAITNVGVIEFPESLETSVFNFARYWSVTHEGNLWQNQVNVYTQENMLSPVVGVYHD